MEDLFVNAKEHRVLKKFKNVLEECYKVEIRMPKTSSLHSDMVFVSVRGGERGINSVKDFLRMQLAQQQTPEPKGDVVLITLSDSEDEETSLSQEETALLLRQVESPDSTDDESVCIVEAESQVSAENENTCAVEAKPRASTQEESGCTVKARSHSPAKDETVGTAEAKSRIASTQEENTCAVEGKSRISAQDESICIVEAESHGLTPDESICIIERESHAEVVANAQALDDSVCVIESSSETDSPSDSMQTFNKWVRSGRKRKRRGRWDKTNKKVRSNDVSPSSDAGVMEFQSLDAGVSCEVSSTTDEAGPSNCNSRSVVSSENVCGQPREGESDSNSPKDPRIPVPLTESLRPIVIDGSNVAMEHGQVTHTFSSKGIQLAVEYFLKRGHTKVTAFVPKFRRTENPKHQFPTTDSKILDEMAKKQLVVFTPSRRLNGKCISSYDDRFIVQLAASNGGVIVSNDNYRDLVDENESFKEAIEQRLLMFCFVGDMFMVPEDPLGRHGPKLSDYLRFPPFDGSGQDASSGKGTNSGQSTEETEKVVCL